MLMETAPSDGEGPAAVEVMTLGFGQSSFRFATPVESGIERVDQLAGKRIATAYPVLLQRYLAESGRQGRAWSSSTARWRPPAGSAWPTPSATSSRPGRRCGPPGLHIIGPPVLASEAILVRREGAEEIPAVAQLRRRLRGVLVARQYVMLDYDCPNEHPGGRRPPSRPGIEGPTVSPLQTPGWSAVRAMVAQTDTNRVMDELWELGARAILVTSIHASPHLKPRRVPRQLARRPVRSPVMRVIMGLLLLAVAGCAAPAGSGSDAGSSDERVGVRRPRTT